MNKLFEHYRIFLDKKTSGYATYSHNLVGDTWGKITQITDSVANGIDIQDGYTENYEILLRNYSVGVGDILVNDKKEYKVESASTDKGRTLAKVVLVWQIV